MRLVDSVRTNRARADTIHTIETPSENRELLSSFDASTLPCEHEITIGRHEELYIRYATTERAPAIPLIAS